MGDEMSRQSVRVDGRWEAGQEKQNLAFGRSILSIPKSTVIIECPHFVHSLTEHTEYMSEIMDDLLVGWGVGFYPTSAYFPEVALTIKSPGS